MTQKRDVTRYETQEPESVETLVSLGALCFQEREFCKAIAFFEEAISRFRTLQTATPQETLEGLGRLNLCLGTAYRAAGENDDALSTFTLAAEWIAEVSDVHLALGQLYHEMKMPAHALQAFKKLVTLRSEDPSAWLTLGFLQLDHASPDEARESLARASTLDPQSPDAHYLLGESLRRCDLHEEAINSYQKLLPIAFEYPQGLVGLAKSLLTTGRLEEGWDAFEFRRISQVGTWEMRLLPQWDGAASRETTLLVHSEDSIGSDLMFASCLSSIAAKVGSCVAECDPSLHTLFARSFPEVSFVPISGNIISEETPLIDPKTNQQVETQISFGTAPRFSRKRLTDFPIKRSYLATNSEWEGVWRERLALLGSGIKVGVLWHGAWTSEVEAQRSVPLATMCRELLAKHPQIRWINLQNGSAARELTQTRSLGVEIKNYPDIFQYDLDIMASLLSTLDLVITPPGYVAHLAGAIGAETWLLLPSQHDWRWDVARGIGAARSVWHRSMTLFRQERNESWEAVFTRVNSALAHFQTPSVGMAASLDLPNATEDNSPPQIFSINAFRQQKFIASSRRAA